MAGKALSGLQKLEKLRNLFLKNFEIEVRYKKLRELVHREIKI